MTKTTTKESNMNLYAVTFEAPVYNQTYYIVAEGFDAAVALADEIERQNDGANGGVTTVALLCECGGPESAFTMTTKAAHSLGFS